MPINIANAKISKLSGLKTRLQEIDNLLDDHESGENELSSSEEKAARAEWKKINDEIKALEKKEKSGNSEKETNSSKETNASDNIRVIPLQDGNMTIKVSEPKTLGRGPIEYSTLEISYNGNKATFDSVDGGGVKNPKGQGYELLQALIHELFIEGSVKMK